MAWTKTPPEVTRAFEAARPSDPRVEARQMFGYPALFVNGHMFAGTFQEHVIARVAHDPPKGAAPFEPMPGRPMKEYVVVPAALARRPAELRRVLERALEQATALPPKRSTTPRSAAAKRVTAAPVAIRAIRKRRTS